MDEAFRVSRDFFINPLKVSVFSSAGLFPHPEEGVRLLRLPPGQDQEVQLVHQGQEEEDHWHRPHAPPGYRAQVL